MDYAVTLSGHCKLSDPCKRRLKSFYEISVKTIDKSEVFWYTAFEEAMA